MSQVRKLKVFDRLDSMSQIVMSQQIELFREFENQVMKKHEKADMAIILATYPGQCNRLSLVAHTTKRLKVM